MCLLLALPLPRAFLWQPLTVLTRQTRQAVRPINQSVFLRCLCFTLMVHVHLRSLCTKSQRSFLTYFGQVTQIELILSVLCCPRWPRQVRLAVLRHQNADGFANKLCQCIWALNYWLPASLQASYTSIFGLKHWQTHTFREVGSRCHLSSI